LKDLAGRREKAGLECLGLEAIDLHAEHASHCRVVMQEAKRVLGRISSRVLLLVCLAPACGCGGLGWYRAAGHIPGIAPTDYAFYNFCGVSSQIFQFTPDQIESSTNVALGDLGFKPCKPAVYNPDGIIEMSAKTPDGRPTKILIEPRGNLTEMKIEIGPIHLGDEELSRDLFRRVALNFGTVIRTFTPIDPTLPKRINPIRTIPAHVVEHEPPDTLKGEGLRPDQNRDNAANEMLNGLTPTDPATGSPLPGSTEFSSGMNPNTPYVPFPFFMPNSPNYFEQ
jgi:hypothetical protein